MNFRQIIIKIPLIFVQKIHHRVEKTKFKYFNFFQLRDTGDDLHTSSKVLSKMLARIIQNKIILALISFIIVIVFIYCIYKILF